MCPWCCAPMPPCPIQPFLIHHCHCHACMQPCLPLQNVITPTTKAVDHDVPISPRDIVKQGLMSQVGGRPPLPLWHMQLMAEPSLASQHTGSWPGRRCFPLGCRLPPPNALPAWLPAPHALPACLAALPAHLPPCCRKIGTL